MADLEKHDGSGRMAFVEALEVLQRIRRNQVVVTTMGATREWTRLSDHVLDFHYAPSSMGQAPIIGLGIALAQPNREVIVLNGDGCMLMNLGCLVTISAAGAKNITLIVLDNGLYEVTGGQRTASAGGQVDFREIARGAGWPTVEVFRELELWEEGAKRALSTPGPRFIVLQVASIGLNYHLKIPGPMTDRIAKFRAAMES